MADRTTPAPAPGQPADPESQRLQEEANRGRNWKRWGPYLSERQWGTVREDYSPDGTCWDFFPHDHARSKAYRWGEDGILGITDRECRVCFALTMWNGRDPILKERLFGLTGPQGNHGEDVKELYYYLDSTPTHSYMKGLYKYPQREYPYALLVEENRRRGRNQPEFELLDTGIFDDDAYWDVSAEYAKNSPNDILIRVTVANRGKHDATLHLLPTLWCRNSWAWGCTHEGCELKPRMRRDGVTAAVVDHSTLGRFRFEVEPSVGGDAAGECATPELLFTENETNYKRLYGGENPGRWVKDAFHEFVIHGRTEAVNPHGWGTKMAAYYRLDVPAGQHRVIRMRLSGGDEIPAAAFGLDFDEIFQARLAEADAFYAEKIPASLSEEEKRVSRQAYAGLLWTKQFYHYVIEDWLTGDPDQPPPPESRKRGRNNDWKHLFNRDVISMPDKWEYPWFAAWDLAFHMIPFARIDPHFAKEQLLLFLREWYMHPNGQLPAYEFAFNDVNPPVHAWACWRVYKLTGPKGQRDRLFLERAFQKLMINFTWWVNRKDIEGRNIFGGGFLGLDNIGVFDRSQPLPNGACLEQADGTAWMAFYCATMLAMALELANGDPAYEDVASKFFEHFVAIAEAMNTLGGTGLWDEVDGFYYDQLQVQGRRIPMRIRSVVGIIPLFTCEVLEDEVIDRLPGFKKRMLWFLQNRRGLARHISYTEKREDDSGHLHTHHLLAIPSRDRLERVLQYALNENELLSPYGLRSLSRIHRHRPFVTEINGVEQRVVYTPAESETGMFGGNSNWRGPIWFPVNYLFVEVLNRYYFYYGDSLKVECPVGSGKKMTLKEVAAELSRRLSRIFLPDPSGQRPCHGEDRRYADDPHWKDLVLYYEYFHGDNGRGVGASHQTGWTALVASLLRDLGQPAAPAATGVLEAKPAGIGTADAPRGVTGDGKEAKEPRERRQPQPVGRGT